MPHADSIRLFICGDVMTGREIDQVLPHPNDPTLHEPVLATPAPTWNSPRESTVRSRGRWNSITSGAMRWRNSIVPASICASSISRPASLPARTTGSTRRSTTACVRPISTASPRRALTACLANNHVLDWSYDGLAETLRARRSGHRPRGCGARRRGSCCSGGARSAGKRPRARLLVHAARCRQRNAHGPVGPSGGDRLRCRWPLRHSPGVMMAGSSSNAPKLRGLVPSEFSLEGDLAAGRLRQAGGAIDV